MIQSEPTTSRGKLLQKTILTGDGVGKTILGFVGYGLSLLMVLSATLTWQWSEAVLAPKPSEAGYMVISRPVNLANSLGLGSSSLTDQDLKTLSVQPFAKQIIPFRSANFSAFASASIRGENLATALFFESIPDDLLDVLPADFRWSEGSSQLPILLGRDFLNLYNYGFATSQGLPQLSADAVGLISFQVTITGPKGQRTYTGKVVGFSDRINSILVPESFLIWANAHVGDGTKKPTSRAMLQVQSGDDPAIANTITDLGLTTNQDTLRLSLAGKTAQQSSQLIGLMALMFMALAVSQLIMSQQLTLAAKHQEIRILKELGYQAHHLIGPLVRPFGIRLGLLTLVLMGVVIWGQTNLEDKFGLPTVGPLTVVMLSLMFWLLITSLNAYALGRRLQYS